MKKIYIRPNAIVREEPKVNIICTSPIGIDQNYDNDYKSSGNTGRNGGGFSKNRNSVVDMGGDNDEW